VNGAELLAELDRMIPETNSEERPGLIVGLAARLAVLGAGLAMPSPQPCPDPDEQTSGGLLTVQEAAAIAKMSPRWLLRHTRDLRFRRDFSRKNVRFEEHGFRRWLETRRRT